MKKMLCVMVMLFSLLCPNSFAGESGADTIVFDRSAGEKELFEYITEEYFATKELKRRLPLDENGQIGQIKDALRNSLGKNKNYFFKEQKMTDVYKSKGKVSLSIFCEVSCRSRWRARKLPLFGLIFVKKMQQCAHVEICLQNPKAGDTEIVIRGYVGERPEYPPEVNNRHRLKGYQSVDLRLGFFKMKSKRFAKKLAKDLNDFVIINPRAK